MKHFVRSAAVAAAFVMSVGTAMAQTTWDMPTPYPDGNFHTQTVIQFGKDIEAATGGAIKITVHSAGSLFKHAEIKNAVRDGLAPIGEALLSRYSNDNPVYGFDSIPFLATSYDDARKLYTAQKPFLEKAFEAEGLMLLYSVPWPPQGIYAKREINSVNDMKGLKFRAYNSTTSRIAELAGAAPVQIEVPDLPTAFATGRVDVMMTSASTGVRTKAEEYLTHYYDTQAWLPRNGVFINKSTFDALPDDQKKAVLDAAAAAEERGWAASIEEKEVKTQALKDAGIIVQPPSAELQSGLKDIGKTLASEWAACAGDTGAALLSAYGN